MRISDWSSDVCSSDLMTSWIGVARLMAANKAKWSGTLVMIGQPAEERGAGARMMLEVGLYARFPKPEYALAFHDAAQRSDERRVGKECVSTCLSVVSPDIQNKLTNTDHYNPFT